MHTAGRVYRFLWHMHTASRVRMVAIYTADNSHGTHQTAPQTLRSGCTKLS